MLIDYRVIKLNNKGPGSIEAQLNELARQGFRLVNVSNGKTSMAILERVTDETMAVAGDHDEHARFMAERAGWGTSESNWQS